MNTADIKPIKKTSESSFHNASYGLLSVVTLGFFAPYVYNKSIANLNMMSRLALGSKHKEVKFSAKSMYCALIAFWFPIALTLFSGNIPLPITLPFTIPINIIMPLLGVCVASGLFLMGYMLKIMDDVKKRLIQIAVSYGRTDIMKLYVSDIGRFSSEREKLNQQAFNSLVDEHNARV